MSSVGGLGARLHWGEIGAPERARSCRARRCPPFLDVNFPPIIARARARERQVFRARAESPNAAGGTSGLTDPFKIEESFTKIMRLISQPAAAPRLSIVVLPFTNLSDDSEQEYFADGITEDLTTDLSRISGSFVIARNTAFTYKGKPVDVKQAGRELGVRYVLEGSVRRTGHQVRVNVQLVDAETGAHLWADRFDTDRVNLPEAQDAIVGRIARTLNVELLADAGERNPT